MTDPGASDDWRTPIAVYGTLRRGERNHPRLAGAGFLGTATVAGTLRVVPHGPMRPYPYPALLEEPAGRVHVELYRLAGPEQLAGLDRLEDFDPADPDGGEYVRRTVGVQSAVVGEAQVYLYRGASEELGEVIKGGDWVAWAGEENPTGLDAVS